MNRPTPFEVHESGVLLLGTKAHLAVGDCLVSGHLSNFEPGRVMNHVYVTETLDSATWGVLTDALDDDEGGAGRDDMSGGFRAAA